MAMSESTHTAQNGEHEAATVEVPIGVIEDLQKRVCDLETDRDQFKAELEKEREEKEELQDDVEYLQSLAWDIEDVVTGEYSLNVVHDDVEQYGGILDRVEKLERGEVDPTDVVMTGGSEPELPIEETVAQVRSDVLDDPSANKQRATVVFRAFGGRARSVSGKMILESGDVKNILEDPEKCGITDPNPNTVRRTMEQCAKLTSKKPAKERDHTDPENLLTVEKRKGRRALVANRDEWKAYTEGVQERING